MYKAIFKGSDGFKKEVSLTASSYEEAVREAKEYGFGPLKRVFPFGGKVEMEVVITD